MAQELKKFNQFNESSLGMLSKDDIRDVFSDIIDEGYSIRFIDVDDRFAFFEFKKRFRRNDIITTSNGFTDVNYIVSELGKLSLMDAPKNRIESMGYKVGFEFESNLTTTSDQTIIIVCRISI